MSTLLEMNNTEVVLSLLRGLLHFYRKYHAGKYENANLALNRAFASATQLTGLPTLRTTILAPDDHGLGRCLNGHLSVQPEEADVDEFFWTGLHEWRHLYLDTITVWVVAYRCNEEQIIELPISNSLIKHTQNMYMLQAAAYLTPWFLRRVVACPRCYRRAPSAQDVDVADKLMKSFRNRSANERPLRAINSMPVWEKHVSGRCTRSSLLDMLDVLALPSIRLFGGRKTDRFKQVRQLNKRAMRRAILAELRARQAPTLRDAARKRHMRQFHEAEPERFAQECMGLYERHNREVDVLLRRLFRPESLA